MRPSRPKTTIVGTMAFSMAVEASHAALNATFLISQHEPSAAVAATYLNAKCMFLVKNSLGILMLPELTNVQFVPDG